MIKSNDQENRVNKSMISREKLSREDLEQMTSQLISILHKRTIAHRFKTSQHDNPRLQYARACITAISVYNSILRDDEIGNLTLRVEALEQLKREGKF